MSFEYQNFATLGVNLNRQKYGPLDISNVFLTQADLNYYLSKGAVTEGVSEYWYKSDTDKVVPYPYEGQIIATVFDGVVNVVVLALNSEGKFITQPVGDTSAVDAAIAELTTAIEGVKSTADANAGEIESLKPQVEDLIETVGKAATDTEDATGLVKALDDLSSAVNDLSDTVGSNTSRLDALDVEKADFATKQEVEDAKTDVITALMGEAGIDQKYDTLKEIADWILSDTTSSAELITRVGNIEKDYLKAEDKEELQDAIDDLSAFVGTLPEGSTSSTVVAYIEDLIDGLKIGDYAKAADLTALSNTLDAFKQSTESRIDAVEGFQDGQLKITAVESGVLALNDGQLSVVAISQDKVTGLPGALANKVNKISSEYNGEQVEWTLLSPENQAKLNSLVIGDNGIEISGKVNADNVEGLATWITTNKNSVDGLVSDDLVAEIASAVKGVSIDSTTLALDSNNVVALPTASTTKGLVKSSDADNKISVDANGEMEVNTLNVNKLVQTSGDELILCGGSASDLSNN